jgi:hypothetical protein
MGDDCEGCISIHEGLREDFEMDMEMQYGKKDWYVADIYEISHEGGWPDFIMLEVELCKD